ncbi:riboflavin biosynthesis protein RibD [Brachybacterium sp. P6-10-X1]|uniref:dihydrofolate reductase family protein n=1 Tax=Brachybacterium sp. P6-10-X1 TaxID=1903186 RepID=UPI0009718EDD|nr:dihydrofolate reductase family protein [Brachybacterium sp. P6-10-X1]APX33159.1 riboflavin biosynthesis protein RibD [Brachybacterium sp. P6-10-X1]
MRELVYYVAVSLDGYIAGPQDQFDAFLVEGDHMAGITEDFPDAIPTDIADRLGIDQSGGRFDSVVMGARTHSIGLPDTPSPYRHLEQVVFTHRDLDPAENLTVTDADPVEVVREMKGRDGGDIWLCGGAHLAAQLRGEIDRLVLKRQPLLFGHGIGLFAPGAYDPVRFDRVSAQDFDSGVSISHYVPRG